MLKKCLLWLFIVSFSFSPIQGYAALWQEGSGWALPMPGSMVEPSQAFTPMVLHGMKVYPNKPLSFDFIVDLGAKQEETTRLVKYFLAALTIPEDDLWVNLSPYEKDRIIPDALGQTELGRDLLAQDYVLKQLTASLIYPEKELGKEFWSRVYKQAQERLGTTQIPVNTFNKVWILPDQAEVYSKNNAVYITKAHLKVMLDEDYLATQKGTALNSWPKTGLKAELATVPIIRDIILPEIEKEVNEGQNFAPVRQMFHALILAKWYKQSIKQSLLAKVYQDKMKVQGLSFPKQEQPLTPDQIYQRYLQAYKKGVFNYVKETPVILSEAKDLNTTTMPRKYFSGGLEMHTNIKEVSQAPTMLAQPAMTAHVDLAPASPAMIPQAIKPFLQTIINKQVALTTPQGWRVVKRKSGPQTDERIRLEDITTIFKHYFPDSFLVYLVSPDVLRMANELEEKVIIIDDAKFAFWRDVPPEVKEDLIGKKFYIIQFGGKYQDQGLSGQRVAIFIDPPELPFNVANNAMITLEKGISEESFKDKIIDAIVGLMSNRDGGLGQAEQKGYLSFQIEAGDAQTWLMLERIGFFQEGRDDALNARGISTFIESLAVNSKGELSRKSVHIEEENGALRILVNNEEGAVLISKEGKSASDIVVELQEQMRSLKDHINNSTWQLKAQQKTRAAIASAIAENFFIFDRELRKMSLKNKGAGQLIAYLRKEGLLGEGEEVSLASKLKTKDQYEREQRGAAKQAEMVSDAQKALQAQAEQAVKDEAEARARNKRLEVEIEKENARAPQREAGKDLEKAVRDIRELSEELAGIKQQVERARAGEQISKKQLIQLMEEIERVGKFLEIQGSLLEKAGYPIKFFQGDVVAIPALIASARDLTRKIEQAKNVLNQEITALRGLLSAKKEEYIIMQGVAREKRKVFSRAVMAAVVVGVGLNLLINARASRYKAETERVIAQSLGGEKLVKMLSVYAKQQLWKNHLAELNRGNFQQAKENVERDVGLQMIMRSLAEDRESQSRYVYELSQGNEHLSQTLGITLEDAMGIRQMAYFIYFWSMGDNFDKELTRVLESKDIMMRFVGQEILMVVIGQYKEPDVYRRYKDLIQRAFGREIAYSVLTRQLPMWIKIFMSMPPDDVAGSSWVANLKRIAMAGRDDPEVLNLLGMMRRTDIITDLAGDPFKGKLGNVPGSPLHIYYQLVIGFTRSIDRRVKEIEAQWPTANEQARKAMRQETAYYMKLSSQGGGPMLLAKRSVMRFAEKTLGKEGVGLLFDGIKDSVKEIRQDALATIWRMANLIPDDRLAQGASSPYPDVQAVFKSLVDGRDPVKVSEVKDSLESFYTPTRIKAYERLKAMHAPINELLPGLRDLDRSVRYVVVDMVSQYPVGEMTAEILSELEKQRDEAARKTDVESKTFFQFLDRLIQRTKNQAMSVSQQRQGGIDFKSINVDQRGEAVEHNLDEAQLALLLSPGFKGFIPTVTISTVPSILPLFESPSSVVPVQ